ncbi:exopolyphosphatase [Jeotgalibacillus sp. ET6]|uniref:exopolyphosphatase n=1 Tax=Jeotgalibacillus sp. ET6 TaxID=3037260 RepID=UPI002418B72B|nr:exopolyphosphatase [Jeotgalibacillus sp. ET6]MDG5470107.1 exopolyphosphatase [Jeotgalibacillus sp. ET6]
MKKTAVIDIGSNTIRLVIYHYESDKGMREIENIKTVARLSAYLDEAGRMNNEGVAILINTLESFKEIVAYHELTDLRVVATAAVRQADNQKDILKEVEKKVGWNVSILTEEEEAYFGYVAVVHSTPIKSGVTIDMGGGSTEITYFEDKKLKHSHSFPFGAVTLKKKFMKEEIMTSSEQKKLIAFLKERFTSLSWLQNKQVPIIAIGGSARNIAQIDQQFKEYPIAGVHQYFMSKTSLFSLRDQLLSKTIDELEKLDGLSSDRADIIAPASQVFCQLFEITRATGFLFSRKGLRDGIVIKELMDNNITPVSKHEVFINSLKELSFDYSINPADAEYMMKLSADLYEQLCKIGEFQHSEDNLLLLKRGAYLYYLGEYIDSESSSQHTFYLIANRSIDGVLHHDRIKLALIASFKNKSSLQQYLQPFSEWFTKEEQQTIRELGALLKFAYSLNGSKRRLINQVTVHQSSREVKMILEAAGNTLAEEYQSEKQKKHLEKALKKSIVLEFVKK